MDILKNRTMSVSNTCIMLSIFNYNKLLSTLPVSKDGELLACDWKEKCPEFVYKPHGHVHTGDLDLVENISLRNIMKMGAKFRETPPRNKHKLTHLYRVYY